MSKLPRGIRNNPTEAEIAEMSPQRRHYYKNRSRQIERVKSWRAANPEQVKAYARRYRAEVMPIERVLYFNAKNRAAAHGVEFTISVSDIVVPEACPVLGISLIVGRDHARDGSPSLDRIDPSKGYIKGNVRVISHKANTIKSNATAEELRAVLRYVESL